LGLLKARLVKLQSELISGNKSGGGGGGDGFDVAKSGDTRIGFVGFPSVGKSTLLTKLTGTFSEAASYEFTTLVATPGQLKYKGANFQMIDLPGIIEGAKDGKGRGRQVIATARTCNMLYIVLDATKPILHKRKIEHELHGFNIRLNQKPPNLLVRKKGKGGISFTNTMREKPKNLDLETVTAVLKEYKWPNADVVLREDCTVDQLIDAIEGNIVYMPCIYVLNKIDAITMEELDLLSQVPHYVPISAQDEWNLDELLETTWEMLNMIRIYTKPQGQIPDYNEPVILHQKDPTIENFCDRIHRDFRNQLKYAWVWGSSVKHQPQKVGLLHVLHDEDVVQLVKKI